MGTGGAGGKGGKEGTVVIKDVATLKALADPLRHQLLSLLDAPRTVKELAAQTARPADRLYYHLGLLERRGLIRADDRRGQERRYQLVSEHIVIDPNLAMPPAAVASLIAGILQRAQREYAAATRRREKDGKKRTMLGLTHLRLTEDQRVELTERLRAIADEYPAADQAETDDGRRSFGLLTGVWPMDEDG
ncbi:MAG TPA: helix-turn-helix domain-containing protein [Acidimicrobiales bacterium]|jgi:DNA-binding transcriptional ArsR family regulator|nr:helix-turn-helix domain-containing protein [Acidimicrobiales bacterium]